MRTADLSTTAADVLSWRTSAPDLSPGPAYMPGPLEPPGEPMEAWEALPPELVEISARIDVLHARLDTPSEERGDVAEWHVATLRYTAIAGRLGICNTPGCLNPKQPDTPWCAREEAMAAEILAEVLAEEAGR